MAWHIIGSRVLSNERGASAIEFALLMPVFLLLILGALAYGIYFGAAHSLAQLGADAARISIAGLDDAEREGLVERFIGAHAGGYAFIDPARLDHETQSDPDQPGHYAVILRYDASHLPIWNLYPPIPMPNQTIAARSTIRNGGL
jgi:Flp pilus assembly protein TadG